MFKRTLAALLAVLTLLSLMPSALASDADTYYIEVDIANQITTVFRSADKSVARQMICSTGKGNSTPLGTFRLQKTQQSTDRKDWYYISTYSCYVKYATRIKGPYLFHSIPYTEKDMDKIDREALAELGSKASHGCVRLRWQDAKWIAMNCPDGTTVRIFDNASENEALHQILLREGYSDDSGLSYKQFAASSYVADEPDSIGRGDTGSKVRLLQKRLLGLGFFTGEVNSAYDNATILAVLRYQSAAGLTPTGIASKALRKRIKAEKRVVGEYSTVKSGCSGPLVSKLQQTLSDLGFFDGVVDGKYGADTAAALNSYCICAGLEPVKQADPKLRSALYAQLKKLNKTYGKGGFSLVILEEPVYSAVALKDLPMHRTASAGGKRVGSVPKDAALRVLAVGGKWCRVSYGSKTGYVYRKSLSIAQSTGPVAHWGPRADALGEVDMARGSVGGGVAALKQRLKALGFFTGKLNALYDGDAEAAVRAYQGAAGLEPTGAATAELQRAMADSDAVTGTQVPLKQGSKGPAVAALQRMLKALQYYGGKCGGSYGSGTAKAVKRFTRTNGLKETGKASPEVQRAILELYLDCEAKYGSGNYALSVSKVESVIGTATQKTSLYQRKSARSKALSSLKRGTKLEVLNQGRRWCRVRLEGKTGYVLTKALDCAKVMKEVASYAAAETPAPDSVEYGSEEAAAVAAPPEDAGDGEAFNGLTIDGYEPVAEEAGEDFLIVMEE